MTKLSRRTLLAIVALAGARSSLTAQSIPADTSTPAAGVGFSLPRVGGTLTYALNASELISNGFFNNTGVNYSTNIGGDLAYVSKSQFHPFSAVYAGGVLIGNSSQPTTPYQSLSFSQVLSTKRWNIVVSDSVSYLPESPAVGLSGIAGVGDLGVDPINTVAGETPGLGILTTYGPRVSNSTSGTVSRTLTGRLSAQASGSYSIQRFIGDNSGEGLNSTGYGGSAGLTYAFSARDNVAGNYNYNNFSFSGSPYAFSTQGGTVSYSRQWSRRLITSVFAGPQVSTDTGLSSALNGSFVSLAAGASAAYVGRTAAYTLSFNRGINNGSGVTIGSLSDSVSLAAHRVFARVWGVSGALSYSHNSTLPILDLYGFNSDSVAFSAQASRGLGRYFAATASYTLEDQSVSGSGVGASTPNAFSGFYQVVSLGITYSPRNILLNK